MEKSELRQRILQQRGSLSPEQRLDWDGQIHRALWQLPSYQKAQWIMVYLSFGQEINTWPILKQAWADGKRTAVPRVNKMPKEIQAIEITNKDQLAPSMWGIYEPITDALISPRTLGLIIVPGLAFDKNGYRLGYGGGFYDRFLPQTTGQTVGLCYQQFILDVPIQPWDQRVDLIISEDENGS